MALGSTLQSGSRNLPNFNLGSPVAQTAPPGTQPQGPQPANPLPNLWAGAAGPTTVGGGQFGAAQSAAMATGVGQILPMMPGAEFGGFLGKVPTPVPGSGSQVFDSSGNRVSSPGPQYDAAGNLVSLGGKPSTGTTIGDTYYQPDIQNVLSTQGVPGGGPFLQPMNMQGPDGSALWSSAGGVVYAQTATGYQPFTGILNNAIYQNGLFVGWNIGSMSDPPHIPIGENTYTPPSGDTGGATQPPVVPPPVIPPAGTQPPVQQPFTLPAQPDRFDLNDLFAALSAQGIAPQPSTEDITRRSGQDITDLENLLAQVIFNQRGYTPSALPAQPQVGTQEEALRQQMVQRAQELNAPLSQDQITTLLQPYLTQTGRQFEDARKGLDESLISRGVFTSGESITENARLMRELDENQRNLIAQIAGYDITQRQPQGQQLAMQTAQTLDTLRGTDFDRALTLAQARDAQQVTGNQFDQQTINNLFQYTEDVARRRNEELATQLGLDLQRENVAQYYGAQGYFNDPEMFFNDFLQSTGVGTEENLEQQISAGALGTDPQMDTILSGTWATTEQTQQAIAPFTQELQNLQAQAQHIPATATRDQHLSGSADTTRELNSLRQVYAQERVAAEFRRQNGAVSIADAQMDSVLGLMEEQFMELQEIVDANKRGEPFSSPDIPVTADDMQNNAEYIAAWNRQSYDAVLQALLDAAKWAYLARYDRANRNG